MTWSRDYPVIYRGFHHNLAEDNRDELKSRLDNKWWWLTSHTRCDSFPRDVFAYNMYLDVKLAPPLNFLKACSEQMLLITNIANHVDSITWLAVFSYHIFTESGYIIQSSDIHYQINDSWPIHCLYIKILAASDTTRPFTHIKKIFNLAVSTFVQCVGQLLWQNLLADPSHNLFIVFSLQDKHITK